MAENIANAESVLRNVTTVRIAQGATPSITVELMGAGDGTEAIKLQQANTLSIDLTSGYAETIVSGSTRFALGGKIYVERDGMLYHTIDPATGSGIAAGTLNAGTGLATLTDWTAGSSNTLTLQSLVTQTSLPPINQLAFRLSVTPARAGSVQIRATTVAGDTLILTPDSSGFINTAQARGSVDYVTGVVAVEFGAETEITPANAAAIHAQPWYQPAMEYTRDGKTYIREPIWVQPSSVFYNEVGFTYLPLDAEILGLDPVRLPSDGRVPMVRVGNLLVVHHTASQTIADIPSVGAVLDAGRVRVSQMSLTDATGAAIDPAKYTTDLDAGTLTVTQSLSGVTAPLTLEHRIEDMARVADVQINGLVQVNPPLTHAYPSGALASTALLIGDMQARVDQSAVFAQETLTAVWSDTPQGNPIFAQYNQALYPVEVQNRGAETERWAIRFISATSFVVIGEHVGQIGTGNVNEDTSPINPATGTPYFTIQSAGWGGGWAAGNVLRFNTVSATYPLWLARTIQPGASDVLDDMVSIETRGDIDRP